MKLSCFRELSICNVSTVYIRILVLFKCLFSIHITLKFTLAILLIKNYIHFI